LAPEERKASGPVQQERKQPRVDAVERNIQALAGGKARAGLTDEEELRLRYLLEVPEGSQAWAELSRFGVTREQEEQLRELDARLEDEYGRTHRFAAGEEEEEKEAAPADDRPDYLAQLRANREQSQAARHIDVLLRQTRGPADLSGIVDPVSVAQAGGLEAPDPLEDVPCFAEVPVNRQVTSRDVAALLHSVRRLLVPPAERRSDQQQQQAPPNEGEPRAQGEEGTPGSVAQVQRAMLAPRRDIDLLLAGVQTDVRRLSELRSQLGGLMDAAAGEGEGKGREAGAGKENGRHDNFAESKRTREIMKDLDAEAEDLYLRYGEPASTSSAASSAAPAEASAHNANAPALEPLVNVAGFRHKLDSLKQKGKSRGAGVNGLGAPQSAAQASVGAGLRLRLLRGNQGPEEEQQQEVLPVPPQPRKEAAMPQKLII